MASDSPGGFVRGSICFTTPSLEGIPRAFQAEAGSVTIMGTFLPSNGDGAWPVVARMYSGAGLAATSLVDPDTGSFSMTFTDIPRGFHLGFITFTSNLVGRRLQEGGALPELCWFFNDECPAALTFKLTWHSDPDHIEGTSDLDLHVLEPVENGEHVYFSHPVGQVCALDHDDMEGFGPEHIECALTEEGLTSKAGVHLYHPDADTPPFFYQFEVFAEGRLFHIEAGSLPNTSPSPVDWQTQLDSNAANWSPEFLVTAPPPLLPAECSCSFSGRRELQELTACAGCMELKMLGIWCYYFGWGCNPSKTYQMYKNLLDLNEPTVDEVNFFMNVLLLPIDGMGEYNHADLISLIPNNPSQDSLSCLKDCTLNALCAMSMLEAVEPWISAMDSLAQSAVGGQFQEFIDLVTFRQLEAFLAILGEDNPLNIWTSVYKKLRNLGGMPVIANGVYTCSLLCV